MVRAWPCWPFSKLDMTGSSLGDPLSFCTTCERDENYMFLILAHVQHMQPTGCAVLQFEMCTTHKSCAKNLHHFVACRDIIFFSACTRRQQHKTIRATVELFCAMHSCTRHGSIKPTDCRDSLHALHIAKSGRKEHCTPKLTALQPPSCTKMQRCTVDAQGRLQVREHGIAHHKMHRDSVALILLPNREQESIDHCL